ncbi:MAG: hypothetical protein IPN29_07000 [Saprospiraceae bacterium]|nr:hypothetical protein [Saprospiraceae bacterium]
MDQSPHFGTSGFMAIPGGYRYVDGSFSLQSYDVPFWSSTQSGPGTAWFQYIYYLFVDINPGNESKAWGLSVRCVKD